MIRVAKSPNEPSRLKVVRDDELKRLAPIARRRRPTSKEIGQKYTEVAADLWREQSYKCAYCEAKLQKGYNDVEHYRPKAKAKRQPGSRETHGYYWLAFTWSNLFFSCPTCNRSYKKTEFPLHVGSIALKRGENPPGKEIPLLLDPATDNGVEFIEFVFARIPSRVRIATDKPAGWQLLKHWFPRARGGDKRGERTIEVCGLDDFDSIELYDNHVTKEVEPVANDLKKAISNGGDIDGAFERAMRLLQPTKPFVGLAYDALVALVPKALLQGTGKSWPAPADVGK